MTLVLLEGEAFWSSEVINTMALTRALCEGRGALGIGGKGAVELRRVKDGIEFLYHFCSS